MRYSARWVDEECCKRPDLSMSGTDLDAMTVQDSQTVTPSRNHSHETLGPS